MTNQDKFAIAQYKMCCSYLEVESSYKKEGDTLLERVVAMREAMLQTLHENLHLADGDNCTLKVLKDDLQLKN